MDSSISSHARLPFKAKQTNGNARFPLGETEPDADTDALRAPDRPDLWVRSAPVGLGGKKSGAEDAHRHVSFFCLVKLYTH